jgi:hypothetical protein
VQLFLPRSIPSTAICFDMERSSARTGRPYRVARRGAGHPMKPLSPSCARHRVPDAPGGRSAAS